MLYTCKFVVADIDLDLVMGLDFFRDHECQIDVVGNILTIHGKSCELTCSGAVRCYRVSVSEKVHIPAMTEMIIEGKVEEGQKHPKELCIIEHKHQSFGNSEMLVARSLCYYTAKTHIRVQSELPRPIKIRPRMYVRRSIMYEKAAFCSSEENSSVAL